VLKRVELAKLTMIHLPPSVIRNAHQYPKVFRQLAESRITELPQRCICIYLANSTPKNAVDITGEDWKCWKEYASSVACRLHLR
jgi:hypothetical protein